MIKSQQNLIELPLEDFLEATKDMIAKLTEGMSKSYLYMLVQLNRIRNGKSSGLDNESVGKLDFGNVIDELSRTELANMLIFSSHNLRLHDWRNISAHHNSKIKEGKIIIEFKPKNVSRHQTFIITREELYNLTLDIHNIFKILKISLDLFLIDHIDEVGYWLDDPNDAFIRPEAELLDFHTALSQQGYKMESLTYPDDDSAYLVLCDMSEDCELRIRAISASQFLYPLWKYTEKSSLQIEYRTKKDKRIIRFSTISDICAKVESAKDITILAKNYQYEVLSPFFTTTYDPFIGLASKFSPELSLQKFYSQHGDLIDAETFIKQFTLSVFANYLASVAEGATPDNISTVYANDGCFMTAIIGGRKIILHIHAPLFLTGLKDIIIECLQGLLKAYHDDNLDAGIITMAKNNNGYLNKRIAIRQMILGEE